MKRAVTAIFFLTALLGVPARAQWRSGDRQVPDEPWRRAKTDFGAMILLTNDVDAFYAEWLKPETPTIQVTDVAHREKAITAVVLFTGCRAVDAKCDIRVDFTVLKPDGSEYGAQKDVPAWKAEPTAPRGVVQVSEASLGIRIKRNDPNGKYLVKATVRDIKAGKSIGVEQPFAVAE